MNVPAKGRVFAIVFVVGVLPACGSSPEGARDGQATVNEDWFATGSDARVIRCPLGLAVAEVEDQIILPKCGAAGDGTCHATGSNPPRMAEVGKIADKLVEVPPTLRCPQDKLVSRANPSQSFMLAKIRARESTARCTDGSVGGPGMPYQDAPQLTADEAACLEWWVYEAATRPLTTAAARRR